MAEEEVNIFEAPWPKDLVAPGRTIGEALRDICLNELDGPCEVRISSSTNAFETFMVMGIVTPDGREASRPLTMPEKRKVVDEGTSQANMADLLEADARALCVELRGAKS